MMNRISLAFAIYLLASSTAHACGQDCKLSDDGYALIEGFEGYSPFIYKDTAGIDTVGFGHAILKGEAIREPLLPPDAQTLLQSDVSAKETGVCNLVKTDLTNNQFDALTSFAYNVGENNLKKSTLLKKVNSGNHDQVPPEFLKWDKAGGVELRGLYLRRKAEAELYAR